MALKVKELKEDALIEITVNKNFYMMVKNSLYYLVQQMSKDEVDNFVEIIKNTEYSKLSEPAKAFYTMSLIIAEIEKVAKEKNLYDEKTVLQPGDEGYVEPTM